MTDEQQLPDPVTFLEGLLPGNIFAGEPPIPRVLIGLMADSGPGPDPPEADREVEAGPSDKPGCVAAESTILGLGFLDGLGSGYGGFGVLRQGKEYLEKGAGAAESLGYQQLAQGLRSIAEELPQVSTPGQASALADRLRPLNAQTWELGRRCNHLYLVGTDAIIALAERVAEGDISLQKAKEMLKDAR